MIKQDGIPHWEYLCKTLEGNLTLKEAWGSTYWQAFPFGLPCNFPLSSEFWCWALGRSCGMLWYIENTNIQIKALQKFPLQAGMKAEKLA